ncbi:TetR/AcrR family transcriptional regulator [Xanthobacter agilis]|uniref:AcrR family transcriptional regulator n=1 Tax=Xanthobacter agilis TaxID=47492 RepID=A0ABU0LJN4_XANAG|nr:TetR/AcrR family transcriptional regulator [Xanthobacter agilis]MDQ0507355.1 AcrR family transcriptional regulator [Xanthobacter agilis]
MSVVGMSAAGIAVPAAGSGRRRAPAMAREARRRAILDAALAAFSTHGFAETKLDEVARRAGVAKGTLYLYFTDKEALFRALVEETIAAALLDADALVAGFSGTTGELLERLMTLLADRVLEGPAAALVRLMLGEGARFPELAVFYHGHVVSRGLALIRQVAQRGLDRGELTSDLAVRFPQLVVAPAILAVVWNGLFAAVEPLDTRALLAAHRELLLKGLGWRDS